MFADQESYLVGEVEALRVTDANRFLRAWHQAARLFIGSTDPDEPTTDTAPRVAVNLAQTFEGRYALDGEMDAEHGHILRSAIDAEVDEMHRVGIFSADDGLSPAERRGQALVQIVARRGHVGTKHGRARPSVEVICDAKTLQGLPIENTADLTTRICEYIDGTPLPPASLARLLCGADLHRLVISADGEILDAGKTIRLANRAQRRALRFRHARHCAFPGCDAPDDWCEAHHVEHWDPDPTNDRGRTDMDNLIPLCRYHHHQVHEGGYTLTSNPTATSRRTDHPTTTANDAAPPPPENGAGPSSRPAWWARPEGRPLHLGGGRHRRDQLPRPGDHQASEAERLGEPTDTGDGSSSRDTVRLRDSPRGRR